MGEMRIMGRGGDSTITWDETKPETVKVAATKFAEYRTSGYLTYRQDEPHGTAELIRTFDPEAKRIVIGAPMAGG